MLFIFGSDRGATIFLEDPSNIVGSGYSGRLRGLHYNGSEIHVSRELPLLSVLSNLVEGACLFD